MSKTREALEAVIAYFKARNILGDGAVRLQAQVKAALAEPEQEPSHWATKHGHLAISASEMEALGLDKSNYVPLYTSPKPSEWQDLSEIECGNMVLENLGVEALMGDKLSALERFERGVKAASAALRAKNGG